MTADGSRRHRCRDLFSGWPIHPTRCPTDLVSNPGCYWLAAEVTTRFGCALEAASLGESARRVICWAHSRNDRDLGPVRAHPLNGCAGDLAADTASPVLWCEPDSKD